MFCTNFLIHDPISRYPHNNINWIFIYQNFYERNSIGIFEIKEYFIRLNCCQNGTRYKISFPIVLPNFITYFELCWSMFEIIFVRLCFPLLVAILTIQYQRVILVLKSPYYCLEHVCISTTRIMLKLIQKKKWKSLLY